MHTEGGGGSRRSSVWVYLIPALAIAAFGGLVYLRVEARLHARVDLAPAGTDPASAVFVAVTHPTRSQADQDVTLPGNVQAYVETPIYARTNGYLKRWYVDIGGRVKAGDLLATIEAPEVDEQLRQAQAAEMQAQANLELAKTTAERYQNLLQTDSVSQQDADQNNSAYKARQADVTAAVADVERLKDLQSFEQVTAPFSGVIIARNVDIGALISAGNSKELFRLAQVDVLRVFVQVPESFASLMSLGTPAELHVAEFPNRTFAGKVTHTSGAIDTSSRTLLTEVDVPNGKSELMPGAYAQVAFHVHGGDPALVVPSNTLVFRAAGPQVVTVDSSSAVRLKNVTIGRDFGTSLEIVSGLQPDDQVVLNPPDSITDGTHVAVQSSPSLPTP